MRLTIVNQFYVPDLAPTGRLAASLAAHRAQVGDDVSVITSAGGYVPQSPIAETTDQQNPKVHRIWTPRAGKHSAAARLADYTVFSILASLRMLTLPTQDVVITLTTPPFIAWAAVLHRLLHPSAAILLWNMDCYPEILERTGLIRKNSASSRMLRWLNRRLFGQLSAVVALDHAMQELLKSQYRPPSDGPTWHVIPNWELSDRYPAKPTLPDWPEAQRLGLRDRFVILYSGNAGFGHSFETVIGAAARLRDEPFSWLFVGGGEKFAWLQQQALEHDLAQIHLVDYVPQDDVASVLGSADCALITMNEKALGVISPSKLHACLAMGLPILYIGPPGGNVDEAIQRYGCGVSLRHGDVDGIVAFVHRLADDPEARLEMSQKARAAFEQAYCDSQTLPQFDRLLATLAPEADAGPASAG
jgi:glycosyltransferase involved in cell wall biosynthesis